MLARAAAFQREGGREGGREEGGREGGREGRREWGGCSGDAIVDVAFELNWRFLAVLTQISLGS